MYDNLDNDEDLSIILDDAVRYNKLDGWRDGGIKEKKLRIEVNKIIKDPQKTMELMDIIKAQVSINPEILQIANIEIDVVRKDIKNMHLAVYPPLGRIRLAVPQKTDEEVLRLFAISKLGWIKKTR